MALIARCRFDVAGKIAFVMVRQWDNANNESCIAVYFYKGAHEYTMQDSRPESNALELPVGLCILMCPSE